MNIQLPDGSVRQYDHPVTPLDVAGDIGAGLAKAAIGAKINQQRVDLNQPIEQDCQLTLITRPRTNKKGLTRGDHDPDALYLLRHSCAHVMAEAITRLWPKVQLAYGPPLEQGFYYDLQLDEPIRQDDFEKIEAEMKKIIAEARPFTRYELSASEGLEKLRAENNKYKIDNAQRALAEGATSLSWYITGDKGDWEDLCMGPHLPNTSFIGAFKVMSVAQSHWHGDITSDAFQRVYGTAFFTEADLAEYLEKLEEARKRDHRVLGRKLNLFEIDEAVGQGLVLWKPNGAIVRQQLQNFIMEHLEQQGYQQVFTPHIGKLDLYRTSGHYPYYADSQFPPLIDRQTLGKLADENCSCSQLANLLQKGELDGYLLKPMNCPMHIKIYASEKRSYRQLPIRLAEFGTVYRWEQSGELGGMTRVRGFTQDDAHLFVTEDQLAQELQGCLELVKIVFSTLGMNDYRVRVGLRDPDGDKYVGTNDQWDKAEAACRAAAESLEVPFTVEPGEAAFYGPKIDFVVKDVIGREWQLGTVQVDYQLPQRFGLSYIGQDNTPHTPVMIHRAPFGSMERFVGVLIEHFEGAFPLWLSPQQVRVLPISDKFVTYAQRVENQLQKAGLRCSLDQSNERVNAKIKIAQDQKIPYMLIVGGRDEQACSVSVRERSKGDLGAMPLDEFVKQVTAEMTSRGATRVTV